VWGHIFQLSFPYLVASAAIAGLVLAATAKIGWQVPLFVLPVMFGIPHSYKHYFGDTKETVRSPLPVTTRAARCKRPAARVTVVRGAPSICPRKDSDSVCPPWASLHLRKRGYISHVVMDQVSILKLIQWNWELPNLNLRNAASGDMLDMFQF
jgi:hypothetical protein